MNEPQRARAIEAIQLELFEKRREFQKLAEQMELEFKARLELVVSQGTKICRRVDCRKEKPVGDFPRDDRYADSRYPYCRACKSKMRTAWGREKRKAA